MINFQVERRGRTMDICRACMAQNDRNEMIFLFEGAKVAEMFSKCTSLEVSLFNTYKTMVVDAFEVRTYLQLSSILYP